jgi:flagellar biogenesis protein FliO
MTGMLIQMAAATAAVVLLIIGLGRLAAKKQNGASGMFDMLGYRSLGPKKGITAMRVGGDVLILGVTANDIRLLASYPAGQFAAGTAGFTAASVSVPQQSPASPEDRVARLRMMKDSLDG